MTNSTTPLSHPIMALENVELTFLTPLSAWDRVYLAGESVVLTAALLDQTIDRLSRSWLEDLDDREAQVRKHGAPAYIRTADADPDIRPWVHGDASWELARADAVDAARKYPEDSAERIAALAEVQRVYGSPPAPASTARD